MVVLLPLVFLVLVTDQSDLNRPAADPQHGLLAPETVFLSHGAFGACPRHILECQSGWRTRLERQPLQLLARELEAELDSACECLAQFVGADIGDLVFAPNTTSGVNAVLRSLTFQPGDELITTDQEYNARRNGLDFVAERSGAIAGENGKTTKCGDANKENLKAHAGTASARPLLVRKGIHPRTVLNRAF